MRRFFVMGALVVLGTSGSVDAQTTDDMVFIHHSVGGAWLEWYGLYEALVAKDYINEMNNITYGTMMDPDPGRPASLGGTPGDNTKMMHWILWFNDYFQGIKSHGSADGYNRIIMFKSCYPASEIWWEGYVPGDPFHSMRTMTNYKAVYRHPDGAGHTYTRDGYIYKPLQDIFAENPDVLFIPVTAPPRHYGPDEPISDEVDDPDAIAHRGRLFYEWLIEEWLPSYNAAHPGLNNVAVFYWFDFLAYADDHAEHPNRLKAAYGGGSGDSHPNETACLASTEVFATDSDNFIDDAWDSYTTTGEVSLGDFDEDGDVDLTDYGRFTSCFTGPGGGPVPSECAAGDFDDDGDIDCGDWRQCSMVWEGPG